MCGHPYNAHTEPLFKKSKILPFSNIIEFFNLQLMHRSVNKILPFELNSIWISNRERRDTLTQDDINASRTLRNDSDLFVPFARLSFSQKQPLVNLPSTWNRFGNLDIKNITNKTQFDSKLKLYLLSNLSDTVICDRLLCPVCHLASP